jgi:DNA mismatch repair protein MutS
VLFASPASAVGLSASELTALEDLQLDQVLARLTRGHEEFALDVFFQTALLSPAAVIYRQAVLAELEDPQLRAAVQRFTEVIAGIRRLRNVGVSDSRPSRHEAHVLAAAGAYCSALRQLGPELAHCRSEGLQRIRRYVTGYVASAAFLALETETAAVDQAIRGVRYRLEIDGSRVSVSPPRPGDDYSAEVSATFARLQGPASPAPAAVPFDTDDLSEVEAQILQAVGRLFPEPFARRARFAATHRDFPDPTVMRFAREVRFLLAYLALIAPLRAAGLAFCFPQITTDAEAASVAVTDAFDLAVAGKPGQDPAAMVPNDVELTDPERIIVVTGPNNGGKTTFARTFGQLHHLTRLGLCIPARSARLPLADRVLTHFEREEDLTNQQGKFDEELVRARDLLATATRRSVIVMNESFNSTSLVDARFVGAEVLGRISRMGCLAVYVTFVDELAQLGPTSVSMVAQVMADDPARRTLRILREPPTGLAHTWALAEKYGLSYDQLMERIEP